MEFRQIIEAGGNRTRIELMKPIKDGSIRPNQSHQFHPWSLTTISGWNTD